MRPSTRLVAITELALLFIVGCSENGTIIQDHPPEWALVESIRIGSLDGGQYPLRAVSEVVPLPDGSLLILQQSATEIPHFESDGRLRRVIGRGGQGPGEFVLIANVGTLADTIWASDFRARKISLFDEHGRHLADRPVVLQFVPERPYVYPWTPRLLAGEWGVMVPGMAELHGTIASDASIPVFKTDRSGGIVDTLSNWPLHQTYAWIDRAGGPRALRKPFAPVRSLGISPGGRRLAIFVPREARGAADDREGLLTIWDETLREVLDLQLSAPAVAIPPDDVLARSQATVSGLRESDEDRERVARELARSLGSAPRYPLADDILVSDAGDVWLQLGFPAEGDRIWWILDPKGERIATVRVPQGVVLKALGPDSVWGVITDEFDVPYVVRYHVARPS